MVSQYSRVQCMTHLDLQVPKETTPYVLIEHIIHQLDLLLLQASRLITKSKGLLGPQTNSQIFL